MDLFRLITGQAPWKILLSLLLGILAGVSYALLIPIILLTIGSHKTSGISQADLMHLPLSHYVSTHSLALPFVILCFIILLCRSASQILIARVALDATTNLRTTTYQRIMQAPIAELEKIGPSKLLVAITTDVQRIIMGATTVPNVLIALVTLAGMLGYILVLNAGIFWLIMAALICGIVTYQVPIYIGNKYYHRARSYTDALQEAIRGLLYGIKELKLSKPKQARYFSEVLVATEQQVLRNSKLANTIVVAAANYGDLLNFIVIAVIIFSFANYHLLSTNTLTGAVMTLLYIAGPVAMILNAMPQVANARISLRRSTQLFDMLSQERTDEPIPLEAWDTIEVSQMSYRYNDSDTSFELGPLSFVLSRGEVTFIVGGNGSGKSTLGKLMALHYTPTKGDIYFGTVKITPESLHSGRQQVAAVFSDFYLFDRLLNGHGLTDECLVERYLAELGIDRKVRLESGRFSTLALSDGEKKRLALLVMFLEDRDVYIFDEWAADQDPSFKKIFYYDILQELKARNKVVVVISHDDRYFHLADKLLIMEEGKLVCTETRPIGA